MTRSTTACAFSSRLMVHVLIKTKRKNSLVADLESFLLKLLLITVVEPSFL